MPFALLDEQAEVLVRDHVTVSGMVLRLVPEILNAADLVTLVGEQPGMVDPHAFEL